MPSALHERTSDLGDVRVDTELGALLGRRITRRGVELAAFLGVPYAAPPVGDLRWRPPAQVERWESPRTAYTIAAAPLQPQPPRSNIMWHTNFADSRSLVMSEDCLYLNVWTPEPTAGAGLPVMVFLHGGGNTFGHGGQEVHDGAALASRGIVVVTINMRVGILGFLAHPELAAEDSEGASGNYGLLDVVAALTWVRDHISTFGGDPDAVTFAGNSAGAAILTHLMVAPAGRGLFRAALGQSSSGIFRAQGAMTTQPDAQQRGRAALGRLADASLAHLRRLSPVSFLLGAHLDVVIDGRLLTRDTEEVYREGGQADIPLLVGTTTDEGVNFTQPGSAAALRDRVRDGEHGDALATAYPVDDEHLHSSARAFVSETRFVYPVWRWARTHIETLGSPTWLYRFDQAPPLPAGLDLAPPPDGGQGYGAYHTSELPYTGDNLDCRPWNWTDADRDLARLMADAWARFVTTGDPNGGNLPTWTPYDGSRDAQVMVFAELSREEGIQRIEALETLDALPRPL